ncbi:EAL domain-containing protein [Cellulomonas sp. APG4]|uniref:putative bifunctional diguanylate cyclase/phosphodiesterase n=1 Tax=Cellulomonas sp. APG4 TaxID=1538656 RepID=UPI00137A5123|nr:EAL domain-containing protein [Cellulomonas sp. APG4]
MPGVIPTSLTLAQCLAAGVVLGLSAMHWGWWRGQVVRSPAAGWTLVWTLVLAGVVLVNGLVGVAPLGPWHENLLLLRFCLQAAAVLVSLPAVHAYAGGPRPRWFVVGLGTWYAVGLGLWLGTDLVTAHRTEGGLPAYGPLSTLVDLVPLAVLAVYVALAVRGRSLSGVGAVVTVAGAVSSSLLLASAFPPPTVVTEVMRGTWVVPLVLGLQVLGSARIAAVRREVLRHTAMRDALAAVGNAAWFVRTPEEILERGRDECRRVLDDPSIEGSLRPLAKDRFVTEFFRPDGVWEPEADPVAEAFLRDMARVVSGAAERQRLTVRLRDAAFTDTLTGLSNRHALDRRLTQAMDKAAVERTSVGVLFCDLDGLKHANDRHGHEWGDRLLVRTADHLRAVVGDRGMVARHGGDEFVVVLERLVAESEAIALARRIRDEFEPMPQEVGRPTITVGVAVWLPHEIVDPASVIRAADLAMLEGKRSHAGVKVFDRVMRARVNAEADLRSALEAGISDGDIVAHFQPLTDALTLEVVGLEVLARWRRDGRLRQPAEWLAFAEQTGLIVDVGKQMFRAAREGLDRFELPVAVNVAARQLDEPDFLRHVEEAWGDDAWDRLTIEVTESALLYDATHVRASLQALASRGVRIAIDDFGTGYNSLSRLGELPLHVLKIDRTFVHDVRTPEGAAVLRAIIALAEAHGLEIVAEGVEHADELTALVEMGVQTVQGHMLGRPAAELPVRGDRAHAAASHLIARHLAAVHAARATTARGDVPRPLGPDEHEQTDRPTGEVGLVGTERDAAGLTEDDEALVAAELPAEPASGGAEA